MSLDACAELVARADPDRFATVMAAPREARARLLPLYAYNLEIARAPWASAEPMIAEMRLQWWVDTVEAMKDGARPAHDVAGPLADLVREARLPTSLLAGMAEARRRDIYADRPTFEELDVYLDQTAGNLMWLAALSLGADVTHEAAVRATAWAQGLAAYLQAVPELEARGRDPLPEGDPAQLAGQGLARLAQAGRVPRRLQPALWPAWQARQLLRTAQREPSRIHGGTLRLSEFRKRWLLVTKVYLQV